MVSNIENKSRTAWLVNQDGLWDIALGLGFLGFTLDMILDTSYLVLSLWLAAYFVVLVAGKEAITRPRLGYFVIAPAQVAGLSKARRAVVILIAVSLALGMIAFLSFGSNLAWTGWMMENFFVILGGMLAAGLGLLGYFSIGGARFYLYAAMVFVAFLLVKILDQPPATAFVFSSGLLLASGLICLVRFLVKFPKLAT